MAQKKTLKGPEAVLSIWINTLKKNERFGQKELNVAKEHQHIVDMGVEQGLIAQVCDGTKPYLVIGFPEQNNGENTTMPPKKVKAEQTEELGFDEAQPAKSKKTGAKPVDFKEEKAPTKKSGAGKPVKAKAEDEVPKKGRRIVYPNDMKFSVLTKLPKKEEEQVEILGARAGSTRFLIRKEMLDHKCKDFGSLREHMIEKGVAFNNIDFKYLVDAGHISV